MVMSDASTTTAVVVPGDVSVVLDASTNKPVAPQAPAPTAQSTNEPTDKPSWLDARLERERKSMLKELGIDSVDAGKKAVDAAKAAEESKRTDAERAAAASKSLESATKENQRLLDAVSSYAKAQLAGLTDNQKAAVAAIAGEDGAAQLKAIEALRPTWATSTSAVPIVPAAKETLPAPNAPKVSGSSSGGEIDHKAIYAELEKSNPVIAARYAITHGIFGA